MSNQLIPKSDELSTYQVMAQTACRSKLFDKIGGEAGLLSIMLMARELGLPPMQAIMGGMNIIQGKVEISPRLMNTMIRKAGHKLEILESTDKDCKIKGIRNDTKEEYVASFSLDDAKRAGLVRSGGGWEKFASDMLFARCISRLARRLFADVISTAYVEGEIDRDHDEPTVAKSAPVAVAEEKIIEVKVEENVIPLEEAYAIERDIQLLIAPLDPEYKKRALSVLKIDSFEKLPMSQLERIKANVAKKIDDLKKKELVVEEELDKIPF